MAGNGKVVVPNAVPDVATELVYQGYTDDAVHVAVKSNDTSIPAEWYISWDGDGTTDAADVVYENADVAAYNYHLIENAAAAAGVLEVLVSYDGSTYGPTPVAVELLDDVTAGGTPSVTIPQNKVGVLRGKFKGIKVVQTGATAVSVSRGSHSVE